jgi:branched-subunit amino acid aminotransferase/4-amino-4-deoxychorismate lyase
MAGTSYVNGERGGRISPDDTALLLGLTVFDTCRTYQGVPFRLDAHLTRLVASAQQMGIKAPSTHEMAGEIQAALAELTTLGEHQIRYTLTGGGNRILTVMSVDLSRVGKPIRVGWLDWEPHPSLPGIVKHGSRASWVVAAAQQGVEEVLLVDRQNCILESNRSNVFAVSDGVLLTPPLDTRFLEGVTRGAMLEAARTHGIPVREGPLPMDLRYDELYLSSTLKELAPVVEVCGVPAAGGGPVGEALLQAFHRLIESECRGEA